MAIIKTIYYKNKITEKQRKLLKFKVTFGNNTFTMRSDGITKIFKGTPDDFSKYLRFLQAKDNFSEPKSNRKLTYKQIVDEIISNRDPFIYVWSNKLDTKKIIIN